MIYTKETLENKIKKIINNYYKQFDWNKNKNKDKITIIDIISGKVILGERENK